MSMHVSVVSIEGSHLGEVPGLFRKLQYVIEEVFTVTTGDRAYRECDWNPDQNRVAKLAYFWNGWTYIVDPELVLMYNDVWLEQSRSWGNRVIGWSCEGASGTYGLVVYDRGMRIREVLSGDGEVVLDEGEPLPEESCIDWSEAWDDDVLELARRLGPEYDCLADREYQVYRLDESRKSVAEQSAED